MRRGRSRTAAAVVGAAALLLAGCGGSDEDTGQLDPRLEPSAAVTPTLDERETAVEVATTQVDTFVRTRNAVLTDPARYSGGAGMEASASGDALNDVTVAAGRLYLAKQKQRGETTIEGTPEAVTVDLRPEPLATGGKRYRQHPFVDVAACLDDREVTRVTQGGGKVKGAKAGTARTWRFHVVNRSWPDRDSWRVEWLRPTDRSC